jgi:hypothetical protein
MGVRDISEPHRTLFQNSGLQCLALREAFQFEVE